MFRSKKLAKTTRIEDLAVTTSADPIMTMPTADLAVVTGGRWKPSWTAPQGPDDIFRDDG